MVWKIKKYGLLLLILTTIVVGSATIVHADVYNGTISTSYLQFFRDIVSGLSPLDDYVFYRSGETEYTMVVGDLSYSDNKVFSGTDLKSYVYTYTSNYGSQSYTYYVTDVQNYSNNVGNGLVYSNLGDYPSLDSRGDIYDFATLFILVIIGLCMLTRSIFKFTYRLRK